MTGTTSEAASPAQDDDEPGWPLMTTGQRIAGIVRALRDDGVDACTPEEAEQFMLGLAASDAADLGRVGEQPPPSAERAQLAVAVAGLRRLALLEPLMEISDGPLARVAMDELTARREYAAGTLGTIARLGKPVPPEMQAVRDEVLVHGLTPAGAVPALLEPDGERLIVDGGANEGWGDDMVVIPVTSAAARLEPEPPLNLARVEVKGFRDLGVVALSETTLAGEPMLRAEGRDGSVAEFPASSVHFISRLPAGSPWPGEGKRPEMLPAGTDYWFNDDEDDLPAHAPECCDAACHGCGDGRRLPF